MVVIVVMVGGWMSGGRPVVVVLARCTVLFVRIRRRLRGKSLPPRLVAECSVFDDGRLECRARENVVNLRAVLKIFQQQLGDESLELRAVVARRWLRMLWAGSPAPTDDAARDEFFKPYRHLYDSVGRASLLFSLMPEVRPCSWTD